MSAENCACCSTINSIRRSNCSLFIDEFQLESYHGAIFDDRALASQNILRAQGNDRCDQQSEEHQHQHERIDNPMAPGMQEVYVVAQIFRHFLSVGNLGNGLELRYRSLDGFLAAL